MIVMIVLIAFLPLLDLIDTDFDDDEKPDTVKFNNNKTKDITNNERNIL